MISDPVHLPSPRLPAGETSQTELDRALLQPWVRGSDIGEHLDVLRAMSSFSSTVVELGVRFGVSTLALLAGRPDKLVSVDLNPCPMEPQIREAMRASGLADEKWEFRQGNSMETELAVCDMLFIDTLHTCDQLAGELNRWHESVRRWIVLHDTETFGWVGEDGKSPGLMAAVEAFLAAHGYMWSTMRRYRNNNGLYVLRRVQSNG